MGELLEVLAPFRAELRDLLPAGAAVVDAHTHLGLDEDGRSLSPEELLTQLDQAVDGARACVFPLHDPERHPAYRLPNDRVLAWADASGGRLVPFCRLDPGDGPVAEGERCLALGARGIKLHPRAQAFQFGAGVADPIFALAESARVPMLIHAGGGLPAQFGEGLVDVMERHPEVPVILAHLGVVDQGRFALAAPSLPNLFFDSSWFNGFEHLALFDRVSPARIVFGSDPPYGRPLNGLYLVLRAAARAGLDERTVRGVVGGTIERILAGERGFAGPGTAAAPPPLVTDLRAMRLHGYCMMAFAAAFSGNPDRARGLVELAAQVCRDPDPGELAATFAMAAPAIEFALRALAAPPGPEMTTLAIGALFFPMARAAT